MHRLDQGRLRQCLGRLSERERSLLVLTFYAEQPSAEIAARLGLAPLWRDTADGVQQDLRLAPGVTLRLAKKLLREGERLDFASLLEMSAGLQALAHKTPHHVEAVNAFVEKRRPDFSKF